MNKIVAIVGRQNLMALLVLLAPSMLVANLQRDGTNVISGSYPEVAVPLIQEYVDGTYGDEWKNDVPPIIIKARILVRLLIKGGRLASGNHLPVKALNFSIQLCAVWASLFLAYRVSLMLGCSAAWSLLSALLIATFVPWSFLSFGRLLSLPYDLPALFFCGAGVMAIVCGRFYWLLLIIAVGTVNKETTIFLIPAYLFAQWPSFAGRKAKLFGEVAVLTLAFVVAYETPRLILQGGHSFLITASGHISEAHLPRWYVNLKMLIMAGPPATENPYWPLLLHVPAILGFRALPWRLKGIYFATPLFLGPLFLVGNFNELRLLDEIVFLGAVSSTFVLSRYFDHSATGPNADFQLPISDRQS